MESKGHFCYGCNEYFHDSQTLILNSYLINEKDMTEQKFYEINDIKSYLHYINQFLSNVNTNPI